MMKRQWHEVRVLYALGLLLVVIGHSHSSNWDTFNHTFLKPLIYAIYTFHMPLFFAIAGFLFQNSHSLEEAEFVKWLKGKAIRLLVPYVFWTLISLMPKYYVEHHGFSDFQWHTPLSSLFYPRLNVWGHLWFLPVLFLVYLVFGAIRSWTRSKHDSMVILVEFLVSLAICLSPLPAIKLLGLSDFVHFVPFFVLGMGGNLMLNQMDRGNQELHSVQMMMSCLLWIISFSLIFIIQKKSLQIPEFVLAMWMLAVSWWLAHCVPQMSFVTFLANNVFTFYIFSWFFQSVVMMLCDRLSFPWYVTSMVMLLAGLLGPLSVLSAYRLSPFIQNNFVRIGLGMR